ncbi:MAG: hypothetical protein H8E73_00070 [Planctomycetes bacterium]|nr:hypothetical protein [Planctomycetota bacterium]
MTTDHGGGNIEIHRDIVRSEDKEEYADFDLSATYRINPQYQLGFSFMNIAGTKLLTGDNEREEIRSFGTGLSYKNKRIHLGGDIILNHDGTADYSVGMNVVPFSNVEVNLGYGSAFDSFVVGAKYRVRKWKGIYIAPTYSFFRNNAFGEYHLIGLSANF